MAVKIGARPPTWLRLLLLSSRPGTTTRGKLDGVTPPADDRTIVLIRVIFQRSVAVYIRRAALRARFRRRADPGRPGGAARPAPYRPGRQAGADAARQRAQRRTGASAAHRGARLPHPGHQPQQPARAWLFDFYLHSAHQATVRISLVRTVPSAPLAPIRPRSYADVAEAMSWLDSEPANLLAAVTSAAADGPAHYAWRIVGALEFYFRATFAYETWTSAAATAPAAGSILVVPATTILHAVSISIPAPGSIS